MRILKKRGLIGGLISLLLLGPLTNVGSSQQGEVLNEERLATAIYWSEGGNRTHFPYGIKSVSCATKMECKAVCIKTLRHRWSLFKKHENNGIKNFIITLSRSYDSGDSRVGQAIWIKNVTRIYYKQGV